MRVTHKGLLSSSVLFEAITGSFNPRAVVVSTNN
jgi:hypothetical protein